MSRQRKHTGLEEETRRPQKTPDPQDPAAENPGSPEEVKSFKTSNTWQSSTRSSNKLHRTVTVWYPSLQDGERHKPHHHADGSQQVAPHVQSLIVDLEEAEHVTTPRQTHRTVPRQDERLPEQRGDMRVSHGGGEGGEEVVQQREKCEVQ